MRLETYISASVGFPTINALIFCGKKQSSELKIAVVGPDRGICRMVGERTYG